MDRTAGHTAPLKLPDYDPSVSEVSWFRDYAAYCGLTSKANQLYAVVAQIAGRKPLLVSKLGPWDAAAPRTGAPCTAAAWQREPLRITFQPAGGPPSSFDLAGSSAVLLEPGTGDPADAAPGEKTSGGQSN